MQPIVADDIPRSQTFISALEGCVASVGENARDAPVHAGQMGAGWLVDQSINEGNQPRNEGSFGSGSLTPCELGLDQKGKAGGVGLMGAHTITPASRQWRRGNATLVAVEACSSAAQ